MRNPVGPLPSSIYWRRRVVVLCLLAVAALIAIWVLNSRGGGGGQGSGAPAGSHTPAATITPGPDPTGTHISGRPGGRDTAPADGGSANGGADNGGSTGTADPDGSSGSSGAAGTTPGDDQSDGTGTGTGTSSGASVGGSDGTSGSGGPVAADSSLPTCDPGSVTLSLASAKNSYSPGDSPAFLLRATNAGGVTCKVDFGPKSAVFTVTKAADSSHVWASDDCPAGGAKLLQVPAHSSMTYTLRWDGKTSSPQCAKPKGQQAAPGTYLVQAQLPGYPAKQLSFYLAAD